MSQSTATILLPRAPAMETLEHPARLISGEGPHGAVLVVYCPVNHCGGVYVLASEMWAFYVPISLPDFLASLHSRGIRLPEGADLETWLDAVSGRPDPHKAN